MVCKDGAALPLDKRLVRVIQYFLAQLELGADHIPVLERVISVGVNPDVIVHLLHSLLSVPTNLYLTSQRLFACQGNLTAKGLPLVVEIPHDYFAVRRSVCDVLQVDHMTHLGGISPTNGQTMPRKRARKTAGLEYLDLACQGLTFFPLECVSWLLETYEDRPMNIYAASSGLFHMLTGREPFFKEALNWLQFTYTAEQVGGSVAPTSMVLDKYTIADGENYFLQSSQTSRDYICRCTVLRFPW